MELDRRRLPRPLWRNYIFTADVGNVFNERTAYFVQKFSRLIRQDPLGAVISFGMKTQF